MGSLKLHVLLFSALVALVGQEEALIAPVFEGDAVVVEGAGERGVQAGSEFNWIPFSKRAFELDASREVLSRLDLSVEKSLASFRKEEEAKAWAQKLRGFNEEHADAVDVARQELKLGLLLARDKARKSSSEDWILISEALDQLELDVYPRALQSPPKELRKELVENEDSYYMVFSGPERRLPWHLAKDECERMGGQLVCIESSSELGFLIELLSADESVNQEKYQLSAWVGAYNRGYNSVDPSPDGWRWMNDLQLDRELWPGSVLPSRNPCAYLLFNKGLGATYSGARLAYVCEWPLRNGTTWRTHEGKVFKAVHEYCEEVAALTERLDKKSAKVTGEIQAAQSKYRKAVEKACSKAQKEIPSLSKLATRSGLDEEIYRLRMVHDYLSQAAPLPDPEIILGGTDATRVTHRMGYGSYAIIDEALGWYQASQWCKEKGGRLAQIKGAHQQHMIVDCITEYRAGRTSTASLWVGASDERTEGVWLWEDSVPFTFISGDSETLRDYEVFPWSEREVSRAHNHVVFNLGDDGVRFAAMTADSSRRFICEWLYLEP